MNIPLVVRAAITLSVSLVISHSALADDKTSGDDCTRIAADTDRLRCYDQAHHRTMPSETVVKDVAATAENPSLTKQWELDDAHKHGLFKLLPNRANYLLPVRYSDSPNVSPTSPAPNHSATSPTDLNPVEAKFQISVKTKVWQNLFGNNGDIWLAYTQQSNWQSYNGHLSAPFRETDFEPEAILSLRAGGEFLGWHFRMTNFGIVHQSNGRDEPLSRSWNRVYAQLGFERDHFMLQIRPWLILSPSKDHDDNPDIQSYMGSGDVRLTYHGGSNVLSLLARYSFSGGHGGAQLDWAFPIFGALRGYVQVTSGYGETLIDYNHKQNTIGVGVLLAPWQ